MKVDPTEEKLLIQKACSFDQASLAEIYDLYSSAIYRYAMRLLDNEKLAEDCVSDTFLRFLTAIRNRSGPREYLQAYLYRIAHNWISDHYRKPDPSTTLVENIIDPAGGVEEVTLKNIQGAQLRKALMELNNDQREAMILKYLEGWENKDIAKSMNKSVGAIKVLLFRATRTLQRVLDRQERKHAQ